MLTQWQPVSSLPEKDALGPFLDAVEAGELDLRQTVYLSETPVPAPGQATQDLPAPEFVVDGLDEVVLTVDNPVPALLLLADMMAPGWQVAVDGESRPLLTADLVLRAVALDAGHHTVRFSHQDPAVRKGLTLTVIGAILILFLLVGPLVWERLRPASFNDVPSGTRGDQNPDA
jgi:hypothetical protein